jgi:hypothetical protein
VSLTRSKAVLELGKRLVTQLDAEDDLLASWMAHYVAQLIETAEKAPPEAQDTAHEACANAILNLWRHRSSLPSHLRPLGELEPVQRTLAVLDVDRADFRYSPAVLREAATADADDNSKQWLELAIGLDYAARSLIRFALRSAAHRAATNTQPWIELARQAGEEESLESVTVRFVLEDDENDKADSGDESTAVSVELSRLESFVEIASLIARTLRADLGSENRAD